MASELVAGNGVRGYLFDAIIANDLNKCLAMPKENIPAELNSTFFYGVHGQTPLHLAVLVNSTGIVDFLLNERPELEVENSRGWTALMSAIANGNVGIVASLVKAGANLAFESDFYGRSALHLACLDINSEVCIQTTHFLIETGVDVSHRDNVCSHTFYNPYTVLHMMCSA